LLSSSRRFNTRDLWLAEELSVSRGRWRLDNARLYRRGQRRVGRRATT